MIDGVMIQYFEWDLPADGRHWERLQADAEHLKRLGFSAVWTPPACKCILGANDTGYGLYDPYDLGEFDQRGSVRTKYGTKQQYLSAIEACHAAGLQVYQDIVLNHLMGSDATETIRAERVDDRDRLKPAEPERTIEAWTKFTYPGRNGRYSKFQWTAEDFDGIDYDNKTGEKGVFLIDGKQWDNDVDHENENYDYLMGADLDFDNPRVVSELTFWGKWYLKTAHFDGFRLDAVKHIRSDFYRDWLPDMRKYAGREMFAVGEYWSRDVGVLTDYLSRVNYDMSLFDVPLHFQLYAASRDAANFDLRGIFAGTLTGCDPLHAVTFVDNHDTQTGQALESWVDGWFKLHAYALILLRNEGYPCVFYGDLYGIPARGIAPVGEKLEILLRLRKLGGEQRDYFEKPRAIGWTRGRLAVVLSSGGADAIRMCFGKEAAGRHMRDQLQNNESEIVLDREGWGEFPVSPGSVSVYGPEDDRE